MTDDGPADNAVDDGPGAERIAVAFVRALRSAGLDVPVTSVITFLQALGEVGVIKKVAVYWAGRSTLLTNPEDIPVFDDVFRAYFLQGPPADIVQVATQEITIAVDDDEDDDEPEVGDTDDGRDDDNPVITVRFSDREVLSHKDFALCSVEELDELHRLMADLRIVSSLRESRREARSKGQAGRPDLRRIVRRALATGGEPIHRKFKAHGTRPRRLVLLVDVSGSMEAYARSLLRFVHAAVVGRTRVEAFTLGTRLTRLTRELSSRDPDAAFRAATGSVEDWSGGTRLGETLRQFNDEWAVRGMARGAVVVILSDGWDRGDPDVLGEQMARLHRVTHRLIWVNPLKASPGYAPLARGMAAALPHVDEFIEGHSLDSLEELARVISA
ncbi:MAG: VWA domain-containing protein [Actinomycetia bacterium]|nr:VWA domain-containing protein [Actinomycetes bacterium]MCP3913569.1 VWA domain-containing protein [Actinomycetes bacterium]MCP4085890.1 VWA domain-containing protein [Actinomycetes bacterium]